MIILSSRPENGSVMNDVFSKGTDTFKMLEFLKSFKRELILKKTGRQFDSDL